MTFGSFFRLFVAAPLAILVTAALFLVIYLQVTLDPFIYRKPGEPNKVYIEIGERTFPICDCSDIWIIPEKPDTSNQWTDSQKAVTEPPTLPEGEVTKPKVEILDAENGSLRYCDGVEEGDSLILRIAPQYPEACIAKGVEGSVEVEVDIDAGGNVTNVEIIKSDDPCFNEAVLSIMTKWKYRPVCDADGEPYSRSGMKQTIKFKMEE